jgi:hypothetical protein
MSAETSGLFGERVCDARLDALRARSVATAPRASLSSRLTTIYST